MCGIFGWQYDGKPHAAQMGALAALLSTTNEERGEHAWGYATSTAPAHIVKGIGPLTLNVPASTLARHASSMVHTRYKTHGDVCVENSHPFVHGNIVGAHNGVIFNEWSLCTEYNREYAVDSRHIFEHIKCGLPASDLEGYGAIEYMDSDDPGAIFLCKMLDGELSIATTAKGVVWSSDRDDLERALQVAGVPVISFVKVKQGRIYRVWHGKIERTKQRFDLSPSHTKRHWSSYSTTPATNTAFGTSFDMKPTAYDARLDEWDALPSSYKDHDITADEEDQMLADMAYHRHVSDDAPLSDDDKVRIVEDITKRSAGKRVFTFAPVKVSLGDIARTDAKQSATQPTTKAPADFISRLLGRNA